MPSDEIETAAAQLHELGPLVLGYFLAELVAGADLNEALGRYLSRLTPELVASVGADSADASSTAAIAALAYVPGRGNA